MNLNLGSCDRRIEGFLSVDIVPPADVICDLSQSWPWDDSSVDAIKAFDIIEHLPDRIHTMNEMWRVLVPGGCAEIVTPNASRGAGYFQDPQHCSPWCLNSFQYFEDGSQAVKRLARSYGIVARFRVVDISESVYRDTFEEVWKIKAILEAVK